MKIQDVARKHPPFDVAAGQAEHMLTSGNFVAVEPAKARVTGKYVYGILPDTAGEPPAITHSCTSEACGLKGFTSSRNGTAHKQRHLHCGHEDFCDEVTAAEYVRQFKDWKKRQGGRQEEPTQPAPKKVWFAAQGAR